METSTESPPCECPIAGFCARFSMMMSEIQHGACRTNAGGYRDHHTAIAAGKPSPIKPQQPRPTAGAGTELHELLASLGVSPKIECGCENRLAEMNAWGVDGCREHFEEIVGWLRENASKYSWAEKLKAVAMAAAHGLVFNPLDPFPGLVRLSIERAEAKVNGGAVKTVRPQPTISIIVTARNYGRFLEECLRSCLRQTMPAVDVIYSDDASEDDSLAVARRIEGVTVIEHAAHVGVCMARNNGVAASRGEVLIHVDGDDRLRPDFVEKHLAALTPDAPFAYGPAQAFGMHDTLWGVPRWNELPIWERNYVNTSAAYWRKAFDAAGGWQETCMKTMWDWSLAIRASRFGRPAPSAATLEYRQHEESWSHSHSEEKTGRICEMLGPARRELARISIGCVYSGRLPDLLHEWVDAIEANIAEAGLAASPELVFLDNSDGFLRSLIGSDVAKFSSVRVFNYPWKGEWIDEADRQRQVATFMANASNQLLAETSGDVLWFVEDDVIPPPNALRDLLASLTDGLPIKGAAAAPYRNRHCPERYVGGYWRDGQPQELTDLPAEPIKVDIAGMGCTLFWRWAAHRGFAPFYQGIAAAHDWEFCRSIGELGRDVMLVPSAECRHYRTAEDWA